MFFKNVFGRDVFQIIQTENIIGIRIRIRWPKGQGFQAGSQGFFHFTLIFVDTGQISLCIGIIRFQAKGFLVVLTGPDQLAFGLEGAAHIVNGFQIIWLDGKGFFQCLKRFVQLPHILVYCAQIIQVKTFVCIQADCCFNMLDSLFILNESALNQTGQIPRVGVGGILGQE